MPTAKGGYFTTDGTKVPSVTSVLETLGWGKEALMYWAWDLGKQGFAYKDLRAQAATIGTIVHERIEFDLCGKPWQAPEGCDPRDIVASDEPFAEYLKWKGQYEIKTLLAEEPLVSEKLQFAGTPDFLVLMRPVGSEEPFKLTLIDIKTSSSVYESHVIQVAAYVALIEEVCQSVEGICKSGTPFVEDVVILQVSRTGDEFAPKPIPGDMIDKSWDLFLGLLKIHKAKAMFADLCARPKKSKKAKTEAASEAAS